MSYSIQPPFPRRRYRPLWPAALLGAVIGSLATALIHPRSPVASPARAAALVCYAPPLMQGDGLRKASLQNQQQPALLCAPVSK